MKEIGKLIELLNDYDSGWSYDDYYGPYQYGQDRDAYHLCKYQLVSKEYGFIKRLVENDKIDMRKAKYYSDLIYYQDYGEGGWACKDYEFVIMLLSISDTPIEDLISYLR